MDSALDDLCHHCPLVDLLPLLQCSPGSTSNLIAATDGGAIAVMILAHMLGLFDWMMLIILLALVWFWVWFWVSLLIPIAQNAKLSSPGFSVYICLLSILALRFPLVNSLSILTVRVLSPSFIYINLAFTTHPARLLAPNVMFDCRLNSIYLSY